MNPLRFAVPFVPCLLLLLPLAAQDTFQLAPAAGASMSFAYKLTQKQEFDAGGQQGEVNQEIAADYVATIMAIAEDGTRSVKIAFGHIRGKLETPMQDPVEFDTAKTAADQEGVQAGVAALVGKEFTAKIGFDGKVTDIAGFTDAAAAARKAAGQQARLLDSIVTDNALANLVRGAIGPMPKEPVAVGAKWKRSEDSGNTLQTTRTMEYSLAKADADTAEIAATGTLASKAGTEGKGELAGAKIEDGKIEGKTIMSRKDAFPVRSDSKATFTVVAMGAEIDITIQIVVERAAAKPAKAEAPADPKPAK
jgi:hypothetical protein